MCRLLLKVCHNMLRSDLMSDHKHGKWGNTHLLSKLLTINKKLMSHLPL